MRRETSRYVSTFGVLADSEPAILVKLKLTNRLQNPVGGWPKDPEAKVVGQYTQAAFEEDGKGTVLHFATALGWKEEEVTVFMAQHRREIRSPKIHAYYKQKVIWGRKPEAA